MKGTRRAFLRTAASLAGGSLLRAAAAPADPLTRAIRFLASRQSAEGTWRSGVYGALAPGDALTPLVLWALPPGPSSLLASRLGSLRLLTDRQQRRAQPWEELAFPLFTAGYAAQVFSRAGDASRTQFWASTADRLRIGPASGWPSGDSAIGAWSDAARPPHLASATEPVPDMLAPNLSATLLGLQAGAAEGAKSLPFVEACQNFPGDGGFFFTPGDPIRNKAGRAVDAPGRFRSYGSATCDGLLALAAGGVPRSHPRRQAAEAWLRQNAQGGEHAGDWSGREQAGAALRYYYAQALAAVLAALPADAWVRRQRAQLRADLEARQTAEGSWINDVPDSSEAEPLVATAFALRALGQLRVD